MAERNRTIPTMDWSPEMMGRALHMIHVLASTDPKDWRSKEEIHAALSEFRSQPDAALQEAGR